MKTYLSNIKPFDIYYAEKQTEFGTKRHYYVCIYTQTLDKNNPLESDIYGLIVTSNPKYEYLIEDDYNVAIDIHGKKSYVCCDKLVRMRKDEKMQIKKAKLPEYKKKQITHRFNKFIKEVNRQIGD